MAHNPSAADLGDDSATSALQRRLSDCLAARAADWSSCREKQLELEADQRETATALKDSEGRVERLSLEVQLLTRELGRLQDTDIRLRQAQVRVTQLEGQEAGYREEIERLLQEHTSAEAACEQLRRQEQLLQGRVQELHISLGHVREQLSAYSEPAPLLPEALYHLLRAGVGLELSFSPGLSAHLAQPAAIALEALYSLVRLQAGRPYSELRLSKGLVQALAEHRERG